MSHTEPAIYAPRPENVEGFSLLEIIVTITIAAILGTIIIQFMGTNLFRSAESVVALQNNATLVSDIERLTLDYRDWISKTDASTPWSDFETNYVNNTARYDYQYVDSAVTGTMKISSADGFDMYRVAMNKGNQTIETLFSR